MGQPLEQRYALSLGSKEAVLGLPLLDGYAWKLKELSQGGRVRLLSHGMQVLCIEDCLGSEEIAAGHNADPCIEISPDALAYILYTSGSTGR